MPALFVYKCKNDPFTKNAAYGDWTTTMSRKAPFAWGGAWATRSPYSTRLFNDEVAVGHLVLAWQVDKQVALGVCEVVRFKTTRRGQELMLKWVEIFPTPVPLNVLKRTNKRLQKVKAFKQGFTATIYDTTTQEAELLLRVCGSRFAPSFRSSSHP